MSEEQHVMQRLVAEPCVFPHMLAMRSWIRLGEVGGNPW